MNTLDLPPALKQLVATEIENAVSHALQGINLVDMKKCQEELQAARYALADMAQNFEVWKSLAEMRGDENASLKGEIDDLKDIIVELRVEIALLQSAVANKGEENSQEVD